MKRMKDKDWTRVLQERLQDAQLPLDGKLLSAPAGSGQAADRPLVWWPYALAGVAAAIIVAVLLLRPAANPVQEADRLVETAPVPDAVKEEPVVPLPQSSPGPMAPGSSGRREKAGAHPIPGLPPEPVSSQTPDKEQETHDAQPSPGPAAGEDAGVKMAVLSPGPAEKEDVWDFPAEPGTRRPQRSRISLRIHAATAGTSFSRSARPDVYLPQSDLSPGRWVAVGPATSLYDSDTNQGNGDAVKWVYIQQVSDNEVRTVPVPKAPALPVAVGLSLSLSLSRSWVLSAGLDYMQRDGYRMYDDLPQSLTLHYLGIPVDVQYYFNPENRWRVYLGAGVQAAKCIAATGGQPLRDPVLFSGHVMAGTDFRLFPGVRLYLAPVLSVPFNRSAYVNTWDDRFQLQVRAGLSFDLK